MKKVARVLFCSDDRGYDQLQVALYSLLKTAETDRRLEVSVFTGNGALSTAHRAALAELVGRYGFASVQIKDVDAILEPHRGELECARSGWGIMIWARCFIGEIFREERGNVVYLDIDTFVCRDLSELYELEMGTNAIAGVYEDAREDGNNPAFWEGPLMDRAATRYFNSGVLVLNLEVFRDENVLAKICGWYAANRALASRPDQDALNALFWNRTIPLHPKYNYSDGWLARQTKYSLAAAQWRGNSPRSMLEAVLAPAVIHFWGRAKPWRCNHRPEGRRYVAAMRELGQLDGALPGTTLIKRLGHVFYAIYHAYLRRQAASRLKECP